MDLIKQAEKLFEIGYICNHCLGRQYAQLLTNFSNEERGKAIRTLMAMQLDSKDARELKAKGVNFVEFKFRNFKLKAEKEERKCFLCSNLFEHIEEWVKKALQEVKGCEFSTFLVGTRLSDELLKNEEKLWEKAGIEHCEPIKNEISREIGKRLEKSLNKKVDFSNPDIAILIDFDSDSVTLSITSIFVYGVYKKLKRGMPQTKWPCSKCRGLGCESCSWTGRQYKDTVEELIAAPFLKQTKGTNTKFHGAGREDIDVLNLAGREFILEIREPLKRTINLNKIKAIVNKRNKGKVQISSLKVVERKMVQELKDKRATKKYRAVVELEDAIKKQDLEKLKSLKGKIIAQLTPTRVSHRRAMKTRRRKVIDIKWKFVNSKKIILDIEAEAGTYIKELINSDNGRTKPSVSEILKTKAVVLSLDVV